MVLALLIEGFFMGAYMKFLHVNGTICPDLKVVSFDGQKAQILNAVTGNPIDYVPLDFADQSLHKYEAKDGTIYSWATNEQRTYQHNGNTYRPGPSGYAMYLNAKNQWRLSAKMTNSDLERYT